MRKYNVMGYISSLAVQRPMCSAIQASIRTEAGVPRSGRVAQRAASEALGASACIWSCGILSTNRAGKKVRINLANPIEVRNDFRVPEACARKSAAPLRCSQKAWIRAKLRIDLHICKAVENLKHQFRVHWLFIVRPHAFADHKPA